jgi:hypothetical protein
MDAVVTIRINGRQVSDVFEGCNWTEKMKFRLWQWNCCFMWNFALAYDVDKNLKTEAYEIVSIIIVMETVIPT